MALADVLRGAAAPEGLTYRAVSTPDRKQARALFDAAGNQVGPEEYAWHNPTMGWDGTSFAGIGEAGNVRFGAAPPPGSGWDKMGIDTSDFINGSDVLSIGAMAAPVGLAAMLGGAAGVGAGVAPEVGALYSGLDTAAATAGATSASATPSWWNWMAGGNTDVPVLDGGSGLANAGGETIHLGSGLPYGATEEGIYAATDAADAAVGSGMTGSGYVTPNPLMSIPGYGDVYSGKGVVDTFKAITGASALKNLFGGNNVTVNGSGAGSGGIDWMRGLPALFGAIGANEERNQRQDMFDKWWGVGAPSRMRYEESMSPTFDLMKIPGLQQTMDTQNDTLLRRLSAGSGNPFGDPGGLAEVNKYVVGNVGLPALQQYRNQNSATGGFGAFSAAAPGAASGAIDASKGIWDSFGAGAADIFKPKRTLADLLGEMQ